MWDSGDNEIPGSLGKNRDVHPEKVKVVQHCIHINLFAEGIGRTSVLSSFSFSLLVVFTENRKCFNTASNCIHYYSSNLFQITKHFFFSFQHWNSATQTNQHPYIKNLNIFLQFLELMTYLKIVILGSFLCINRFCHTHVECRNLL